MCQTLVKSKDQIVRFSIIDGVWRRDSDGFVLFEEWIRDEGYQYAVIGNKGYYIVPAQS